MLRFFRDSFCILQPTVSVHVRYFTRMQTFAVGMWKPSDIHGWIINPSKQKLSFLASCKAGSKKWQNAVLDRCCWRHILVWYVTVLLL